MVRGRAGLIRLRLLDSSLQPPALCRKCHFGDTHLCQRGSSRGNQKLNAEKCQSTGLPRAELLLIITQPNCSNSRHPRACYIHAKETRFAIKSTLRPLPAIYHKNVWLGQAGALLPSWKLHLRAGDPHLPFGAPVSACRGKALAVVLVAVLAPVSLPLQRHHFPPLRYLRPETEFQQPSYKGARMGSCLQSSPWGRKFGWSQKHGPKQNPHRPLSRTVKTPRVTSELRPAEDVTVKREAFPWAPHDGSYSDPTQTFR